ncbi:MAG: hypothetical protein OQK82_07675, partial [Candidatus Pacearchaeota archaeon]|nr:hypothetical protein [Candidatus Pacearchaeota archaeon]
MKKDNLDRLINGAIVALLGFLVLSITASVLTNVGAIEAVVALLLCVGAIAVGRVLLGRDTTTPNKPVTTDDTMELVKR